MHGPLSKQYDGDSADQQLVHAARGGSSDALDALVRRHQGFIYGIVLRMLWNPQDAEDATQEILIKIVTGLSSFRGESAFRTWAYRIATNHVLNSQRSRAEKVITGFDDFGTKIDELPDLDLAGEVAAEAERRVLAEETRVACLTGMLLCLDRAQRLTYILGEVFDVSDTLGSEILGITRQNFRQRLARARRQLYEFMRGKCGLVNSANPCRCSRKTRGAIRAGIVDPKSLKFVPSHVTRVEGDAKERSREFRHLVGAGYAHLFRDQNLKEPPDLVARLRAIVSDQRFRTALDLDSKPS
jgi:RNA polymerase sigma factor (sigma-70 family)